LTGALLLLLAAGCTSTEETTVAELPGSGFPSATFLTKDGSTYWLRNGYTVVHDSIFGGGTLTPRRKGTRTFIGAIPVANVQRVEVSEFNTGKTVLFVAGVAATIGIVVALSSSGSESAPPPPSSQPTKFSCPFLFTYDGKDFLCESETFAGSVHRGLERKALDPLAHLRPVDGRYRVLLVNAREETEYVDELNLLLVDHPSSVRVAPDGRGELHTVESTAPPVSAADAAGRDVLALISERDGLMWQSDLSSRDFTSDDQYRDGITLEFPRPAGLRWMKLAVTGKNTRLGYFALRRIFELKGEDRMEWYEKLESDPAEAARFARWLGREGMLHVSVWQDGGWVRQAVLPDVGPGVLKEQLALLDLARVSGANVKVKLETATDLWRIDRVGADFSADLPLAVHRLKPLAAVDPRAGDVTALLETRDGAYYVTTGGMVADVSFEAPPVAQGLTRTVLGATTGFYHQWHTTEAAPAPGASERIMDEPLYGSRLLMGEWLKERDRYEGALPADLPPQLEHYVSLSAR
jgi:hypothetical protein